jgi:TRAP-type transport system periplasmic protein
MVSGGPGARPPHGRKTSLRAARRAFIGAGAAAFVAFPSLRTTVRAAQFEFKAADHLAISHPLSVRATQMWAAVEKESGGRIRTQFFPAGQLGSNQAQFAQLRVGALNFLLLNPGDIASVIPAAGISLLGFAFKNADESLRVHDGALGEYVRKETAAKGVVTLRTIWDSGMIQISVSSHPIRTPEDLRDLKIRVNASKITLDLFRTLGASATSQFDNELYTALQTHLVDGEEGPLNTIQASRYYEVQKYISMTNHQWQGAWMIANADTWKSLPPDLQELIERINTRYAMLERRDSKLVNASVADMLAREGPIINLVDQTPFRTRLGPYYESWATAFGSTEWGILQSALGRKLG